MTNKLRLHILKKNKKSTGGVLMKKIMVSGCLGQIGTELVTKLRHDYGAENVLATDIREARVSLRAFSAISQSSSLPMEFSGRVDSST